VTEADIQRYAEENGLPMEYVAPFFAGLVAEGSPLAAMMASVPFHTFSRYVGAREEALRRIFSTIDTGAALAARGSTAHRRRLPAPTPPPQTEMAS